MEPWEVELRTEKWNDYDLKEMGFANVYRIELFENYLQWSGFYISRAELSDSVVRRTSGLIIKI
jgi:hypothetical protein